MFRRVTVVIPSARTEELKALAESWREEVRQSEEHDEEKRVQSGYAPGGDAKAISRIASEHFGGYRAMFVAHGWPERGSEMIRKVQSHITKRYGSIANFEAEYPPEYRQREAAGAMCVDQQKSEPAKVCPICGHVFRGKGWDGIDAHWRAHHETVMPYELAWPLIRDDKFPIDYK